MSLEPTPEGFVGTSRFELRHELGTGGFGKVFRAFDREADNVVALKLLHRTDPSALRRFKTEFRSLANLSHDHLVSLFELHQEGSHWFFTMEYVDGQPFNAFLRDDLVEGLAAPSLALTRPARPSAKKPPDGDAQPAAHAATGSESDLAPHMVGPETTPSAPHLGTPTPTPPSTSTPGAPPEFLGIDAPDPATLAIWEGTRARPLMRPRPPMGPKDLARLKDSFRQLVEALAWLHDSGHLHRDVKPSNVLVTSDARVKVLDFGLVTRLHQIDAHVDAIIGTPTFMAPEVCAGLGASPASDWYSVGVMLYLALTGRLPFSGDMTLLVLAKQAMAARAPGLVAPGIPSELDELCAALLARNPYERPDAGRLLDAFSPVRDGRSRDSSLGLARPRLMAFVGRRAETAALSEALDTPPRLVLVEGASGLGKTTFVEHVLRLREHDHRLVVLRSRCFERGSVRYRALDGAVDDLARHLGRLGPTKAEAYLPTEPGVRSALAQLFPVLPITRVEAPSYESDPLEIKRRAFLGLRHVLAALSAEERVVIFVDDAQWADADSEAPLFELFRAAPSGLSWVITYRDEDKAASPFLQVLFERLVPAWPAASLTIQLSALSEPEARALAAEHLKDDAEAARVAVEAGGHPLLITELARATGDDGPRALAPSLATLLAARVHDLGVREPKARHALELVAVAGEPIPTKLVRLGSGADQRALNILIQEHFLTTRPGGGRGELVLAWHDRVRETIVLGLSESAQVEAHRALAAHAEAAHMDDPAFLYSHWRLAGNAEAARRHGLVAAEAAAARLAFDRAVALYRGVVELTPEPDVALLEALARASKNAGRGREAGETYVRASQRASGDEAQRLEIAAAEQFLFAGAFAEGEAVITRVLGQIGMSVSQSAAGSLFSFALAALRLKMRGRRFTERPADSIPPADLRRVDALWSGTIGLSMSRPIAAQAFQKRHFRFALQSGDPYRIARAYSVELAFSGIAGGSDERVSEALSAAGHAIAKGIDDPYPEAFMTMSDGAVLWLRGRWQEAQRAIESALAVYENRCTGVVWEKDTARFVTLSCLAHRGELAELARRLDEVLRDARARGDLYLETQLATRFVPIMRLLADDPDGAIATIDEALARWKAPGFQIVHYWGYLNRVDALLYAGRPKDALAALEAGKKPLGKSFMLMGQYYRAQYWDLVGRVALACGHALPDARARASKAYNKLAKERMIWTEPLARLLGARLEAPGPSANAALGAARDAFVRAGMKLGALACDALIGARGDAALRSDALGRLSAQGARNPERFVSVTVNSFGSV